MSPSTAKKSQKRAATTAKSATPKILLDLLNARGPSGYETAPAAVWRDGAKGFAKVSTDVVGTPLALVAPKHDSRSPARRLLVMGHIDEIGLIVTHIDEQGYLWFGSVGGWDAQILVGQRVVVDTRAGQVTGVVGKKPIHLLREDDRKKVAEVRDLHIDIGARDGDDARERVRVGDVAVIDADPMELPNGRLISRALDNRLGSFVALEAARLVAAAGGSEWELAAVAVAQEEITFGGSRTSAFSLEAGCGDCGRRHARDRCAGDRCEGDRQARARLGTGDQPRIDAASAACSSCCTRRRSGRRSRSRSRRARAAPVPTPTRCTSAARVCPRAWYRSRSATCTRRSSSSSSTTCTPAHA